MSDLIDRQAAIDALHMHLMYRMGTDSNKKRLDEWINNLPSAQPERKLQKLAEEIATVKRSIKSDNSDYLTGYLCALSVVEGMIADIREVNHE